VFRHQHIATCFPLFGKCSNKPSNRPVFMLLVPELEAYNISLSQNALVANAALWYGITVYLKEPLSGHIQPLHKGRDSSPRTQNVDHLRTRSCAPGMQTPPPSLPISRDLSVTEVEYRNTWRRRRFCNIRRRTSTRFAQRKAYSLALNMSSSSIKTHKYGLYYSFGNNR
jgi:hypothetical protein